METAASSVCRVFLSARQDVEGDLGACGVPLGFQAHTHDAVKGEGQKADERVGADAVGQSVMNRRNLDVGFQHAKAAFDIGQCLVARNGVSRGDLGDIGQQDELAIKEGYTGHCLFIDLPAEPIGSEVSLDEAGEFGIGDGADDAVLAPLSEARRPFALFP